MKLYSDEELARLLDQDIFHLISDVADELGVECYVVGGYVRDIFLERPSNDIDVVVVGKPHHQVSSSAGEGEQPVSVGIAVAKAVKRRLGRSAHLSVFKNFGTAQVKVQMRNGQVEMRKEKGEMSNGQVEMRNEKGEMRNENEEMRNDVAQDISSFNHSHSSFLIPHS